MSQFPFSFFFNFRRCIFSCECSFLSMYFSWEFFFLVFSCERSFSSMYFSWEIFSVVFRVNVHFCRCIFRGRFSFLLFDFLVLFSLMHFSCVNIDEKIVKCIKYATCNAPSYQTLDWRRIRIVRFYY